MVVILGYLVWGRSDNSQEPSVLEKSQKNEFKVNAYTKTSQINPDVAMDDQGNFFVVWSSKHEAKETYDIFLRRFNSQLEPLGKEVRVNDHTKNNQKDPKIACNGKGDLIVAWESWYQERDDGYEVYGKRYDQEGQALSREFRINTNTIDYQLDPSVTIDSQGNFTAVWLSYSDQAEGYQAFGQRFNNKAEKVGSEFLISQKIIETERIPELETAEDLEISSESERLNITGNKEQLAVVWQVYEDENNNEVYAKLFDNKAKALTDEFKVNQYKQEEQQEVSIDMNEVGEFVITWHSLGQDGSQEGVYARQYNEKGETTGNEFQVNQHTKEDQGYAAVGIDKDGSLAIAWESRNQGGEETDIFARTFDCCHGVPSSNEFQVNEYTKSWQEEIGLAYQNGRLVVVWMPSFLDTLDDISVRYYTSDQLENLKLYYNFYN